MSDLPIILSGMRRELELLSKSVTLIVKTQSQRLAEEWNRKQQASKILGISLRTLNKLTSSGKLPVSKVNGLIFIKTSDIERLLNENYIDHFSTNPSSTSNSKNND
ncbi:MAG TPA: helix-turn-helix domain-containing protein [Prolixibacteraceae bacterium]|jgi:hypothetical protein